MPTWDWAESSGSTLNEKPRIVSAPFGDGYVQTSPDGLNPIAQEWQLRFAGVSDAAGNEMMAFLRERGGWQSFDWAPRWATALIKVKCPEWSRSQPDTDDRSDITARFVQVFEP
jgi:phage-related protein